MKKLLLSLFFIFLTIPANAVTEEALPVVCDKSKLVFDQLKAKQFQPVLMGSTDKMTTMVFVNKNRDMVVSVSIKVESEYMTCIFIAGEKNAELF